MAALTGQTIASTYPQLLKTAAAGGISGSPTVVEDGDGTSSALSISTGGASVAGTLAASGNFAIDTSKFTVVAASGNTAVAGTFDTAGDFKVNVNKFTVAALTGNTVVAGTLNVSGATQFSANVNVLGTLSVGTLNPTTLVVGSTASVVGNFDVNTNKFTVNATSGDTAIAGTLGVSGAITGSLTGNASTATTLATARTIAISGDVTGTATSFDGSSNITISSTITPNSIVDADINSSAAIADTKLATISTPGKVAPVAVTGTAVITTDPRLSDARTPTAHKITHAQGGTDAISISDLVGTGSLVANAGGNARGTSAVDLQLSRTAGTQVASGNFSVIGGGANNTARENYTFVGGGRGNTAQGAAGADVFCSVVGGDANSAQASFASVGGGYQNNALSDSAFVAGGRQARADRIGMFAHSAGQFAANGDAQSGRFVLRCKTTTNSAVEMALNGSTTYLTIPSGKVLFCNIKVVGSRSDGSAVATYERQYAVKNVAGTSSEIYAPVVIGTDFASGTSLSLTTNNTGDYISIQPTGVSAQTWRWVAVVDAVEVAYGV